MKDIIEKLRQFNKERDWAQFHTPVNIAKSLMIESAELLELFQWQDSPTSLEHLKEEIADVMLYAIMIADHYGFDVKQIITDKMKKNGLKYPVTKSKGKSDKYTKL